VHVPVTAPVRTLTGESRVPADLRALIFDVDGTLAETERDGHRVAFNRTFEEAGLDWHWDDETYGRLLAVTGGKERMFHYWRHTDPVGADHPDASNRIAELHRRKSEHYEALVREGTVTLRPGIRRLLLEARASGLRLAIATTTSPRNVTALIEHSIHKEAIGWFEVIGAGDDVPQKKPAPDVYLHVLRELALHADACLAVEDSPPGLQSALRAGIDTVVTRSTYTRSEGFAGAIATLDDLGEPDAPAFGLVHRAPWRGHVTVANLRNWHGTPAAGR